MSVTPPVRLTRRQGLTLAATLAASAVVTACGSDTAPTTDQQPSSTPAPALAAVVAGEEAALIALYDAVLSTLGDSDERRRTLLIALRQQHVDHRDALLPGATPTSEEGTAPVSPGLRDLAAAERKATKSRIRACVEAEDPELARTLAFIAASEASHVPALVRAL